MKVVIVDDSAADRRLCRILLEEAYGSRLEVLEPGEGEERNEPVFAVTLSGRSAATGLANLIAEKDIQIQELHHRVKNNLQVVATLLRLQAEASTNPMATAVLRESQLRVEAIAMIHRQLSESAGLRGVTLAQQTTSLMTNLFDVFGVDRSIISGHVAVCPGPDGAPLFLGIDQAVPVGLILNEIVSNSLKHAFPRGRSGSIRIEAQRSGSRVELAVKDDGVGVPEDLGSRKTASLGLQIVEILARQLKGTWELKRQGGTAFRMSFPET